MIRYIFQIVLTGQAEALASALPAYATSTS